MTREELERFRAAITRRLGLQFDDGKFDQLSDVLRERMAAAGCDTLDAYAGRLETQEEWRALAERLTVTETYFFRYWDHFRAFSDVALRGGGRTMRILSAGCASGEEAYTLAILARERGCLAEIEAFDVNPAMIARAARGRYTGWSLRETPPEMQGRYFRAEGREFVLEDSIRSAASFAERNLVDPDPVFWSPDRFDVVFCRNVLMYFSADAAKAAVARIARALKPGGHLFLGHAETLRGLSEEFHLRHTHRTFYYEKHGQAEPVSCAPATVEPPVVELDTSWFEAIRRASDRISVLADAAPIPAAAESGAWNLGMALELLREERFAEAMNLLPSEASSDADAMLLRAVLLTNRGDLEGAERACVRLLDRAELNAGAHYLMALCREHSGDRQGAVDHDQIAVYLDTEFAMPRLHLGLLARRAGDLEAARRELGEALVLLAREDASRILLFGGGFHREALMELCRRECAGCGGTS